MIELNLPKMVSERCDLQITTVEQLVCAAVMNGIGNEFDEFFPTLESKTQAKIQVLVNGREMETASFFQRILDHVKEQEENIGEEAYRLVSSKMHEIEMTFKKILTNKEQWEE